MDIVRVLRIIEYVGPRDQVEETIARSIHGTLETPRGSRSLDTPRMKITAVTIGDYPEILREQPEWKPPKEGA
jgi:hypothetical protein